MAVELGFLGAASYAVYRDVASRFPASQTSPVRSKRLRGEPSATLDAMAEEVCDPAVLPVRAPRSHLRPGLAQEVRACCESLGELKWIESTASGAVPAYSGSPRVTCLNDLGQGTTVSTRNGNKIICKAVQLEGFVHIPANQGSDLYRLIVVIDSECYGSICSFAQYVQASSSAVYALPSAETVGKGKRFTTLVDKFIAVNNVTQTTAGGCANFHPFSIRIPLNLPTHYSGNAGTISDIIKNSLCVIECSQYAQCISEWQARLTFLDM